MSRRSLFAILTLSSVSALAACGSDEPPPPKSTALALEGTYRPTQDGPIASITFARGKDYYLVPSGCTGGGCVDIGTYRLDAQANVIVLLNGETGREQTIKLENVKTSEAVMLVKAFIGTRDLTEPEAIIQRGQQTNGGQQQVSGDQQQQLNDGQQGLAEKIVELVKTIVEAFMNDQNMKKDDEQKDDQEEQEEKKDEEEPKPDAPTCKDGVPTNESTQEEKLAYAARCPNGP